MQSRGPPPHGQSGGHCSGPASHPRRKALLIGINYFRTKVALKGCINDVHNLIPFLEKHGFVNSPSTMVVLTDDNPQQMPTKWNIISAIMWLVHDNQPDDVLFFHYSGHGGTQPDPTGMEEEGFDSTILPSDYATRGQIIDDDLYNLMVKPLQKGVTLVAVFDSCHSGTALDLPYIYKASGHYHGSIKKAEIGAQLLDAGLAFLGGHKKDALKSVGDTIAYGMEAKHRNDRLIKSNTHPANIIHIAGCKDVQTSADGSFQGKPTGAMSYALMAVFQQNPNPTLTEVLNGIRDFMYDNDYTQIPQMSTSHEMDPQMKFPL